MEQLTGLGGGGRSRPDRLRPTVFERRSATRLIGCSRLASRQLVISHLTTTSPHVQRHSIPLCRQRYGQQPRSKKNSAPCGTDGRLLFSGFQLLVTLILTLDRVML